MDTNIIDLALQAGAEAAAKGLGGAAVKDAYNSLKSAINRLTKCQDADQTASKEELGELIKHLLQKLNSIPEYQRSPLIIRTIRAQKDVTITKVRADGGIFIGGLESLSGSITISDVKKNQ